jgi:hypothetical protein
MRLERSAAASLPLAFGERHLPPWRGNRCRWTTAPSAQLPPRSCPSVEEALRAPRRRAVAPSHRRAPRTLRARPCGARRAGHDLFEGHPFISCIVSWTWTAVPNSSLLPSAQAERTGSLVCPQSSLRVAARITTLPSVGSVIVPLTTIGRLGGTARQSGAEEYQPSRKRSVASFRGCSVMRAATRVMDEVVRMLNGMILELVEARDTALRPAEEESRRAEALASAREGRGRTPPSQAVGLASSC